MFFAIFLLKNTPLYKNTPPYSAPRSNRGVFLSGIPLIPTRPAVEKRFQTSVLDKDVPKTLGGVMTNPYGFGTE